MKHFSKYTLHVSWSLDFVIAPLTSRLFPPAASLLSSPVRGESAHPPCASACSCQRKPSRSLHTGSIRVRTCEQRASSWPRRWLCLPQCPGRRPRWSMTSWAASPGEHPSSSGSMSTSTWTGWSGSSCCRVGKHESFQLHEKQIHCATSGHSRKRDVW